MKVGVAQADAFARHDLDPRHPGARRFRRRGEARDGRRQHDRAVSSTSRSPSRTSSSRTGEDPVAAAKKLLDSGVGFLIVDLPADALLKVADLARATNALVFNASAPDERLREEDCRANVIHTAPSRAMLADALAEYLIWKQWRKWLLVVGSHPEDVALGEAYERAAKKFGAKIVEKRTFEDAGGGRRSDSGVVQTQRQMPVFTQKAPDYDVLIAADENEVFGGYLPYRTWDPRPVAGSGGLMPTSWDPSHELWGAVQLQNRFERMFHRGMTARDNQAWVAMRMIGDAVNRTKSADPKAAREAMLAPDFDVADFKGVRLTLQAMEPSASPADPLDRRTRHGLRFAAGRLSSSGLRARHARPRPAGDEMQAQVSAGGAGEPRSGGGAEP